MKAARKHDFQWRLIVTNKFTDPRTFCPSNPGSRDWWKHDDSCYYMFGEDTNSRTFYEARGYCQSQGGDLVSFSSQEEENSMHDNVLPLFYDGGPYWIGMQRKEDTMREDPVIDYDWIDGSLSDYRNFEGS